MAEVEFDVRQSADGVLVLSHDRDLSRLGGGPVVIAQTRFDVLRDSSVPITRLDDLLGDLPVETVLHADVKQDDPAYPGLEDRLVRMLEARGGEWTIASADVPTLKRLRALAPHSHLGYQPRLTPIDEAFATAQDLGAASLRLNIDRLSSDWIARAEQTGKQVFVYPVDTPEQFGRMREAGVDAVFARIPDAVEDTP